MISVPALAEKDLGDTIEGEFGIPVALINPDGVTINQTVNSKPLKGFVRRSYKDTRENEENVIINSPVVKLRITSLPEIPTSGAKWKIGIPENPRSGSGIEWFDLDPKLDVEVNKSRGTIKLYLTKMRSA